MAKPYFTRKAYFTNPARDLFHCTKKRALPKQCSFLVRETGLEPVRDYHTPLKRARLPIPPLSLDGYEL